MEAGGLAMETSNSPVVGPSGLLIHTIIVDTISTAALEIDTQLMVLAAFLKKGRGGLKCGT